MLTILKDKFIWLIFLALVLLRLPTMDRPLSKHHDFNTAVVLINAESWEQANGGAHFNYTPLLNYQSQANKVLDTGYHIDSFGNHVYLSFGAGWYVLPYFLLKAAGLPFAPLSLQILNIIINLITIAMLYRLIKKTIGNKHIALAGTVFFAFLPAPLWYCGNGYVTTGIMLPWMIGILSVWHSFEKDANQIRPAKLSTLLICGIALCYFDWVAVFLLASMCIWALFKIRKNHQYVWVLLFSTASIALGIWLVLAQFASYLGWHQVLYYWKYRFMDRSVENSEFSLVKMCGMAFTNLATGYLPLFFILPFLWIKRKTLRQKKHLRWPLWALVAMIPYNGIFLNWSAVHEFAWMAFALIASITAILFMFPLFTYKHCWLFVLICTFFSLVQYFIINKPGPVSWKGDPYNSKMKLGKWIKANVDSTLPIFSNSQNDKITEYYCKRTVNGSANLEEAKLKAYHHGIKTAIWLHIASDTVKEMVQFSLK